MYSNKQNVNILTALLLKHGVRHAVLCPGNRNAPIVHNLNECGINCYAVTDERSAGFFALGMRQATGEMVAVCVTSGSALLNLAPAVAEASMQHQGIIVISADRPAQWIDQLDGQTLPQSDALASLVAKRVTLPEPHTDEERWYCNRLVNEALVVAGRSSHPSVHINVPISEPLFTFDVPELPDERCVRLVEPVLNTGEAMRCLEEKLSQCEHPMIVIGQLTASQDLNMAMAHLSQWFPVLREPLAAESSTLFDDVLSRLEKEGADMTPYLPDFILYVGGNMVSKRLRQFLRRAKDAECWVVDDQAALHDTFMNLTMHIVGDPEALLATLMMRMKTLVADGAWQQKAVYHHLWNEAFDKEELVTADHNLPYSPAAVVAYFEEQLEDMEYNFQTHYANSTAVRLGCRYAQHHVWCNRGVNGIEGCLSTAVGFAAATSDMVFCVVGDLSFFYDQNALWNQNLSDNLRIILLNNHGGEIFKGFKDAQQSAAFDKYIRASHSADARGICTQNDIGYLSAHNMEEMKVGIVSLLTTMSQRPMLLECFFE